MFIILSGPIDALFDPNLGELGKKENIEAECRPPITLQRRNPDRTH
jgi:hypothetical protein